MGTSTIIDIIGSFVIAGFLLLMVNNLNGTVTATAFTTTSDLIVQQNMTTLVRIIEEDFRRIGYCKDPMKIPDPTKSIRSADQHSIEFLTDVNNDGFVDTVKYSIGTTAGLTSTPNPRDMLLYRTVNKAATTGYSLGVTKFDFLYYNAQADSMTFPITTPSAIYAIRLSILLESPFAYDTIYSYAYWRQLRLAARNLKNR
jgi:hypothetical protein